MVVEEQSKSWPVRVLGAVAVVVAFYALSALALRWVGLAPTQEWLAQFGWFSRLVFIALSAGSLIVAPLSGSSLYILGGTLFGQHQAYWLSWVATLVGCSVNFWIARCWGRRVVVRLVGPGHVDALDRWFADLETHHSIFYMFLVMHLSQDIVSYALGLTRIPYRNFFIALSLSALTVVGFFIYLGSSVLNWLVGT
ncbi:MAG: VTT domain-containing protein [Gloeomargarita sp. SKYG116]|nr:VTT domain-containing protein [Gloeomargarita sp. SKYG116]MCS7227057.1 VTT domain-containing protein [Gloeomargarita sp. SKYB31]MDW8400499.1 VTT domain-containing protein [Gloeomargarita sp. SKYGB_i_bin116]